MYILLGITASVLKRSLKILFLLVEVGLAKRSVCVCKFFPCNLMDNLLEDASSFSKTVQLTGAHTLFLVAPPVAVKDESKGGARRRPLLLPLYLLLCR